MEGDLSSRSCNQCWMAAEHLSDPASCMVSADLAYPSSLEAFLGEVGDAIPEPGFTNAGGGYYGGVHDAEYDGYMDRGVT